MFVRYLLRLCVCIVAQFPDSQVAIDINCNLNSPVRLLVSMSYVLLLHQELIMFLISV